MLLPRCRRLFRKVLATEITKSARAQERRKTNRSRLEVQSLEPRMLLAADFCISPDMGGESILAAPAAFAASDAGSDAYLVGPEPSAGHDGTNAPVGAGVGDDHGDKAATATAVADPSSTDGVLGVADDVDYFSFNASIGRLYTIETTLDTLGDSTLTLYDTDGTSQLEYDDDSGVGVRASKILWTAPATGTYFVKVDNFNNETGAYVLGIASTDSAGDDHGNDAGSATSVNSHSSTAGNIGVEDDVDWFAVDVLLGNEYTFETVLGTLTDTQLRIYDTDGTTVLATNDDISQGVLSSQIVWTAPVAGTYFVEVDNFDIQVGTYTLEITPTVSEIVGRSIFYDGSAFDGDAGIHSENDDAALDTSKVALVEEQAASFDNYTGYTNGITGLFVDIKNLASTPTASDFEFRVGNSADPTTWAVLGTAPTVGVRPGDGVDNSSRVSLIWPAGTIVDQWVQVTVRADGPNAIVPSDDIHYWGNQRGETGNDPARTTVNSGDFSAVSANYSGFGTAPVTSAHDLNKDGRVNSGDNSTVSFRYSGFANTLLLFAPPPQFDVFNLSSKPDSDFTLFIDFDGHVTTGTIWNQSYNITSITSPGFDLDGDTNAFGESERNRIFAAWQEVAEDFAPFDINVTTKEPALDDLMNTGGVDTRWGVRAVVTDDTFANCGCGGHAFLNSFASNVDTPTFVYNQGLTSLGKTVSHEVGHMLGLRHDGDSSQEYYPGHGGGQTRWGALMGAPFGVPVTQWNDGDYYLASNQEDDLAVITGNGFGFRADDYGDTPADAASIPVSSSNTIEAFGIIGLDTDVDYFSFDVGAGDLNISIDPITNNPNLDIFSALYDASGNLVFVSNPSSQLSANITATVAAGTYVLRVEGVGSHDSYNATTDVVSAPAVKPWTVINPTGYSSYGSLGQFHIQGTVPAAAAPIGSALAGSVAASSQLVVPHEHSELVFSQYNVGADLSDPKPLQPGHVAGDEGHGGCGGCGSCSSCRGDHNAAAAQIPTVASPGLVQKESQSETVKVIAEQFGPQLIPLKGGRPAATDIVFSRHEATGGEIGEDEGSHLSDTHLDDLDAYDFV